MKKFTFPLERVLAWRRTQVHLEEAKLAQLTGQRQALEARESQLRQSLSQAQSFALAQPTASSVELAAREHFRTAVAAQTGLLAGRRRTMDAQSTAQLQAVLERRRAVELLERLRRRRWESWKSAHLLELDQLAEESHRSRMSRETHQIR